MDINKIEKKLNDLKGFWHAGGCLFLQYLADSWKTRLFESFTKPEDAFK